MENQHRLIPGYRDLTQDEIESIVEIKECEKVVAVVWNRILDRSPDLREMALAKAHFEDAFMHFVKAVAKPDTPWETPF